MSSLSQAALFFAVVGGGYLLGVPYESGAERFAVLLGGSVLAATAVYLLPWVYVAFDGASGSVRVGEAGDE